jgi:hypothetical protein
VRAKDAGVRADDARQRLDELVSRLDDILSKMRGITELRELILILQDISNQQARIGDQLRDVREEMLRRLFGNLGKDKDKDKDKK